MAHDHSIFGESEYVNFEYSFNKLSILAIICTIYTIPVCFILLKMIFIYFKSKRQDQSKILSPELFCLFLIMQVLCLLHVITKFLVSRLPHTGLITAWCATEKPQSFLKLLVFFNYGVVYSKYAAVISFCTFRVILLFSIGSAQQKINKNLVLAAQFLIFLAFFLAIPRYISRCTCSQLGEPFPTGSVIIMTMIDDASKDTPVSVIIEIIVQPVTFVLIISLNIVMFIKFYLVKQIRNPPSPAKSGKNETVFTTTMILLILPIVFNIIVAFYECFDDFDYYIYLIRPFFIDAQSHIITCYFYFTHPIFIKKSMKTVTVKISVSK